MKDKIFFVRNVKKWNGMQKEEIVERSGKKSKDSTPKENIPGAREGNGGASKGGEGKGGDGELHCKIKNLMINLAKKRIVSGGRVCFFFDRVIQSHTDLRADP